MSVYRCPHCTSVQIIVGDRRLKDGGVALRAASQKCPRVDCGGILDLIEDERDARQAVGAAYLAHDHTADSLAQNEMGDAP